MEDSACYGKGLWKQAAVNVLQAQLDLYFTKLCFKVKSDRKGQSQKQGGEMGSCCIEVRSSCGWD